MKTLLVVAAVAAATGYAAAGSSGNGLASAYNELKDLTLIGMAERETVCAKATDAAGCRISFNALIDKTFDAEALIFDALSAEGAGDDSRSETVVVQMQNAAIDCRRELNRLRTLHVP